MELLKIIAGDAVEQPIEEAALVYWSRALASSAASVACAIVLGLACVETVHRFGKGEKFLPSMKLVAEETTQAPKSSPVPPRPLAVAPKLAPVKTKPLPRARFAPRPEKLVPVNYRLDHLMLRRQNQRSQAVVAAKVCDISRLSGLIDDGIDVLSVDGNGESALGWAVRTNCRSVLELLLSVGGSGIQKEGSGLSPIDWAFRERNVEIIQLLTENSRV